MRSYRDVAPLPAALEPAGINGARFILKIEKPKRGLVNGMVRSVADRSGARSEVPAAAATAILLRNSGTGTETRTKTRTRTTRTRNEINPALDQRESGVAQSVFPRA